MKKAIILLIVSFLCGTASAQTRTELIRSIKERLAMCSGVSNIETAGSNFRAYINTPMQGVYEFDLDALRKPFSSDGVVDINCASSCEAPIGCIRCSSGLGLRDWKSPNTQSTQDAQPDEHP